MFKKEEAPFSRGLLLYMIYYNLYTISPLPVFKIKIGVKEGSKKCVYKIHLVALLAYKSNGFFK
jgi:hypothetical protein